MSFAGIIREEIKKIKGREGLMLRFLLTECNFIDNPGFTFDNIPYPVKRGQYITSLPSLSSKYFGTLGTPKTNSHVWGKNIEKETLINKDYENDVPSVPSNEKITKNEII